MYEHDHPSSARAFSATAQLRLHANGRKDFGLWHTAPVLTADGVALLGEIGKVVPVSNDRIVGLSLTDSALRCAVRGVVGEAVTMSAWVGGVVVSQGCRMDAGGRCTMVWRI